MELEKKQRSGLLTAWLILMFSGSVLGAIVFLNRVAAGQPIPNVPDLVVSLTVLQVIANPIFLFYIFRWEKWAVYATGANTLLAAIVGSSVGMPILSNAAALIGLAVLFALLRPVWSHLGPPK
jgi:hypothetical protein